MLNHKNEIFLLILASIYIIWTSFSKNKESFNTYNAVKRDTNCYLFCRGNLMNCPFECNQKKLTAPFP